MDDKHHSRLPDPSAWRFDSIRKEDPQRASALETAGKPAELIAAIVDSLDRAIESGDLRVGREPACGRPNDFRVVVQFAVGEAIFDWFFNAMTGYRAHFRADCSSGLAFNDRVISAVESRLAENLADPTPGRLLDECFHDRSAGEISKSFVMASLGRDRSLSKVWYCGKRIGRFGGVEIPVLSVGGPKILLDDRTQPWLALCPDDDNAWLDVKGAFLGKDRPYQIKDPVERAKELHDTGGT